MNTCIIKECLLTHRTGHIYDALEMYSKSGPEPQPVVYDNPSVDNSKDVEMEENPAYQTTN